MAIRSCNRVEVQFGVIHESNAILRECATEIGKPPRAASITAFQDGAPTRIDDGTNVTSINLVSSVSPGSMVFDSTKNYSIGGAGSINGAMVLEKKGGGTLTLSSANGFTGGTVVSGGTVAIANAAALGTGPVTLAGGTWDIGALSPENSVVLSADSSIIGRSTSSSQGIKAVSGTGVLTLSSASNFDLKGTMTSFSGTVRLTGTGNFRLNGTAGSDLASFDLGTRTLSARNGGTYKLGSLTGAAGSVLTIASYPSGVTFSIGASNQSSAFPGVISNGSGTTSVIKVGTGTLTLSGASTYTGTTSITAGRLALSGSLTSAVSADSGSTFAPLGLASTTGNVTVPAGATFQVQLLGAQHDRLTTSGTVTLGGTLDVIPGPNLAPGTTFTVLSKTSAGAVSGTFSGLSNNATFTAGGYTFRISYTGGDGNDIVLTLLTSQLEQWRYANFGSILNTASGADHFDGNSDGEANLLEFATAQNPHAATLTQPALVKNGATLEFTYTRSLAALADAVAFTVEWSDTLSGWSSAGVTEQILSDNGTVQSVRASVAAGASGRRFLHLKVMKP